MKRWNVSALLFGVALIAIAALGIAQTEVTDTVVPVIEKAELGSVLPVSAIVPVGNDEPRVDTSLPPMFNRAFALEAFVDVILPKLDHELRQELKREAVTRNVDLAELDRMIAAVESPDGQAILRGTIRKVVDITFTDRELEVLTAPDDAHIDNLVALSALGKMPTFQEDVVTRLQGRADELVQLASQH